MFTFVYKLKVILWRFEMINYIYVQYIFLTSIFNENVPEYTFFKNVFVKDPEVNVYINW